MRWNRVVGIVAACALIASVSGCGKGTTIWSDLRIVVGSAAPPVPKAKFVARAEKLCREALFEAEKHALYVVENKARYWIRQGNLDEARLLLRHQEISTMLAPALGKRIERVRNLGVPAGDELRLYKLLKTIREMAWEAQIGVLELLSPTAKRVERIRRLARAYGIEACGVLYRYHGLYDRGSAHPGVRLIPGAGKPALPKRVFVAKANRLCSEGLARAEQKAVKIFEHKAKLYIGHGTIDIYKAPLKRQEIAIVLAPMMRHRLEAVAKLDVPRGDEERVKKILSATDRVAQEAENNPLGFKDIKAPFRYSRQLARGYGIEACTVLYRHDGLFQKASAKPGVRLNPRSSK
jgi:hypothetical protein